MVYVLRTQVERRGAITVAEIGSLRKMHPTHAASWLRTNKPDITQEEFEDLLASVQDRWQISNHTTPKAFPMRAHFIAAAWMAGATWGQLCYMFGSTRQTLSRSIERILPPEGRQSLRIPQTLTHEQISLMRQGFLDLYDQVGEEIGSISILDLAKVLLAVQPEDEKVQPEVSDPYLVDDVVTSRVTGESNG